MFFKKTYELSFRRIKRNIRGNTFEVISDTALLEFFDILKKSYNFKILSFDFPGTYLLRDKIKFRCHPNDKMKIVECFCKTLVDFVDGVRCI